MEQPPEIPQDKIQIDMTSVQSLTFRETIELEKITGVGPGEMMGSIAGMAGLVWVALRRSGEDISYDEVLDTSMERYEFVIPEDFVPADEADLEIPEDADPQNAGG